MKLKRGDRVDRKDQSYSFPGTVLAVYENVDDRGEPNGEWCAVVRMDTYKVQHIFRVQQLVVRED
jgi:hypothetical protein